MEKIALQDMWPEELSYCWGCGRNNKDGLQIKSYWDGEEGVCVWEPKDEYMAAPGILCGGIISTIIDCHCLNTAVAAAYKEEGREIGTKPFLVYTTRAIKVDLIKPIPTNEPLTLRARLKEKTDKKVIISCSLYVRKKEYARGEMVGVIVPPIFWGYEES